MRDRKINFGNEGFVKTTYQYLPGQAVICSSTLCLTVRTLIGVSQNSISVGG